MYLAEIYKFECIIIYRILLYNRKVKRETLEENFISIVLKD